MKKFWANGRWKNRTVVIVTPGPSAEGQKLFLLSGLPVIAVNDGFKYWPKANVLLSGDRNWLERSDPWVGYFGRTILATTFQEPPFLQDPRVLWLRRDPSCELSDDPRFVGGVKSSVFPAVNLAILEGAKKIILLNLDLKYDDKRFADQEPVFWDLAEQAEDLGIEILNCSPDSDITCFTQAAFSETILDEPDRQSEPDAPEPEALDQVPHISTSEGDSPANASDATRTGGHDLQSPDGNEPGPAGADASFADPLAPAL